MEILTNKQTGFKGEDIASGFLERKGYKILFRNWLYMHKEIDIVAQFKNELVIVEVKTRAANSLISPLEAVNYKKQRMIIEAANAFIEKHNVNLETRFDIVTIVYSNGKCDVEHIENAFYPRMR
jgi:putative endonuclease